MAIACLYPIYIKSRGPAYACQSIIEAMRSAGADVKLFCITAEPEMRRPYHRYVMPMWGKRLWFRVFSARILARQLEWRFRHSIRAGDVAYVWPGASLETIDHLKSKGHVIVTENINTHQANSKAILDAEYNRLGLNPSHGIGDAAIAEESAKLRLVDYVYSPSKEVTQSLLNVGVPESKIIATSYGLDSTDVLPFDVVSGRAQRQEISAVFVGRIGVRKGVHLLLDYWIRAGVEATLKLVGDIEPDARNLIMPYLERPGIEHVPFTFELMTTFRDADMHFLPSLEEGSPLVTYLSLGAGLPSLVSPMGSGGIIRDGVDGLILDPHDADGWIEGIRYLFSNKQARRRYGLNAYDHAKQYFWPLVGRQRLGLLRARMADEGRVRP